MPESDVFWRTFAASAGVAGADYVVCAFGDAPEMADALIGLVLAGTKRATASLVRDFGEERDPLPRVGDHVVVVDGRGVPRCIWRTTEIAIKALDQVDDAFAWDEGEGDRTRAWWLDAHRHYFARQAEREGFVMHDAIEVAFERFVVVWPPEVADPPPRPLRQR